MPNFRCKLDPEAQPRQIHQENQGGGLRPPPQRVGPPPVAHPFVDVLILLERLCILDLGVEFTSKHRHLASGKHAQELDVDF